MANEKFDRSLSGENIGLEGGAEGRKIGQKRHQRYVVSETTKTGGPKNSSRAVLEKRREGGEKS